MRFIETHIPELAGCLYPVFTTDIDRLTVVYTITPVSGGHLRQSQLEIKVIGSDIDECERIAGILDDLLDMEEDQPFVTAGTIRFHSGVSGGGCLFNSDCQRYEDTRYYILDWRPIDGR